MHFVRAHAWLCDRLDGHLIFAGLEVSDLLKADKDLTQVLEGQRLKPILNPLTADLTTTGHSRHTTETIDTNTLRPVDP
jgi:hypothetical protein